MFDKFKRWIHCKHERIINPSFQYPDPELQQRHQNEYNELQQMVAYNKQFKKNDPKIYIRDEHKASDFLQRQQKYQSPYQQLTNVNTKKPKPEKKLLRERNFRNSQVAISFR